ncbi:right-handed parallel beta-helix repeat-containing protein [Amycolatopsis sp. RTGN1]|uniref:right-handed parallel beta-helix repeat-containing protein n=1 Tax=Amycolatopsis ponsaeliensis TaxID=2992142 RepID=UPI00254C3C45|nr:right-handed parallel beta-helix repeat-containing protein [Amycolatopsis sp. RTGN1]
MKRNRRRALLVTSAIAALSLGTAFVVSAAAVPRAGSGPGGCFDPVAFGAVPDDGVDDRVPVQAALDAASAAGGGTVCLGSGRWRVSRAPVGSYDRFAALSTHGAHVTLTGTGPGSVLELVGDQQAASVAVLSLDPGASDVTVQRLMIDTSAATNTDEQTHAIAIGSGVCTTANGTCSMPVTDVTVRDVVFAHPPTPGARKGDCIRVLGNTPATAVKRVTIAGGSFVSCARSGIGVQRNVFSLAVLGNHFGEQIGDTAFDGEATGGDWDDGLRLEGNSFADSTVNFSASLTSYRHATITGNTFAGKGLSLYRTEDVVVADNTFDVTALSGAGVVDAQNVATGDKIAGNIIRRHGVAGPGIRITPHSGGIPAQVTVTGNTIALDGDADGIYGDSVHEIGVRDNDITFTGAAPNGSGVTLQGISGPIEDVMITGNTVTGASPYFAAVRLDSRPEPFHGVTVALNASRGAARSLQCSQRAPGGFPPSIISTGNRWNVAPTCPVATLQPGQ